MKTLIVLSSFVIAIGFGLASCDSGGEEGDGGQDSSVQQDSQTDSDAVSENDQKEPGDSVGSQDEEGPDDSIDSLDLKPVDCESNADCASVVGNQVCKSASCNLETGLCELANLPDGTACDDGDACTINDACLNGICGGEAGACCGDGNCNLGETCKTCVQDCGACPDQCNNSICDTGETCESCPGDCGVCSETCGNDTCDEEETCETCAFDCGTCMTCQQVLNCAVVCLSAECVTSCASLASQASAQDFDALWECVNSADCEVPEDMACIMDNCLSEAEACNPNPVCGNDSCELGEECGSCATDCCSTAECGDGQCNGGEDFYSCPGDCPNNGTCQGYCGGESSDGCYCDATCLEYEDCCPDFLTVCNTCGDSVCLEGETCTSCPDDCGTCPICGNGTCDTGETCSTCETDCGVCEVGSCVGKCGEQSDAGCWCDEYCSENGDCCPDFATVCA